MKGTKETVELIDGIVEAVKAGKSVRDIVKDGVDMTDLPKAFELIKEQSAKVEIYAAAAKDVALIKEELQDLDKAEIISLVMKLAEAVSEIEKA
jgi:urease gamma subunit